MRGAVGHRLAQDHFVEVFDAEIEIPRSKRLQNPFDLVDRRPFAHSPGHGDDQSGLPAPILRKHPAAGGNAARSSLRWPFQQATPAGTFGQLRPTTPRRQPNSVASTHARQSHRQSGPFVSPATCDPPVQKPDISFARDSVHLLFLPRRVFFVNLAKIESGRRGAPWSSG